MQRGCMKRNSRKDGPDVWQFRWSETRLDGKRFYHKKIVGTVEQADRLAFIEKHLEHVRALQSRN
jgi:hypothetical protein